MATKIAPDSERATPVSYKWSIVTFSLSRTVFELFAIFVIMGFPISGPQNWGFLPLKSPKMVKYQQDPPKGTSLHGNTCFRILGAAVWRAVRPVREEKKVGKKNQVAYISPHHPDDPRRVANVKLCPLRQTPEVIILANFQLALPLVLASRGSKFGVSH